MTLPIDTTRAARARAARHALVEAVRDAPASEQETNWLEWKGQLDLTDKATHTVLAKAVLGFANREVDRAALAMGGTAYLLVGVQPGGLPGVRPVDMAALEPQIVAYTGPGPQWSGDYIDVQGSSVLVVTVEAPQWGDPVHPVRKAFQRADAGQALALAAIYVRQAAATELARPADIDMLTRRAQGKPQDDDRLVLDVGQADGPGPGRVDLRPATLEGYADAERGRLLLPLRRGNRLGGRGVAYGGIGGGEFRKPDVYEAEVGQYIEKLNEVLPRVLLTRSVAHDVGALRLQVQNPTDRPFNQVQVRVRLLDPELVIVADKSDSDRYGAALPKPPRMWGTASAPADYGFARIGIPPVFNVWAPEVERLDDAVELVFPPEDVRPHTSTRLNTVWLLLSDTDQDTLGADWTATSTSARGQANGSLTIRLDGPCWQPDALLAEADEDD